MTYSHPYTNTTTFNATHAWHIAAKVATDLKRIQRFYGSPSDSDINKYEVEAIALLKSGYLGTVIYGFKRNGLWIEPTLRYTARDLYGASLNDDDPGRIRPGANIDGASFSSYLVYSQSWYVLPLAEQEKFKSTLPFKRTPATEPGINGYMSGDLTYSSGGRALERAILRSFQ